MMFDKALLAILHVVDAFVMVKQKRQLAVALYGWKLLMARLSTMQDPIETGLKAGSENNTSWTMA